MQFLLSFFFIVINFSLQHSRYKGEILKFSLTVFTESFGEEELLGNTCSISFGLHDINIDAHNFYNLAKKEEENSTIKFLFLSVDDYERSLSFLSEACNGNKYVDASMKRHAAFPSTPNKLWVRSITCFCQNCFGHLSSLKQHAMVGEWLICSERGIP